MYEDPPDVTLLRQGDVIGDIYFPKYSYATMSLLHKLDKGAALEFEERAIVRAQTSFAVVISQCCEFNVGKRNAFSLARLNPISRLISFRLPLFGFNLAQLVPARGFTYALELTVDQLREANRIDEVHPEQARALNAYLYEARADLLSEPYVADFTQVMSIRMEDMPIVLARKVLQLDRQHREEMQFKLGYFYSRRAE